MLALPRHTFELDSDGIRAGIARNEFFLVFQPVFTLKPRRIVGCEALIRWHHPVLGVLSPDLFVPIIESDAGLELYVVEWVLHQLKGSREVLRANGCTLHMSMNISPQLLTPCLSRRLVEITDYIAPEDSFHWLVLEIVERGTDLPLDIVAESVKSLRANRFRVSLDDFGVGSSSWVYLASLEVDVIKIDRQFVQAVTTERGEKLVRAMVAMAAAMDVKVVAEGVEVGSELQALLAIEGIGLWQGYHGAIPMTLGDLLGWLKESGFRT